MTPYEARAVLAAVALASILYASLWLFSHYSIN